MDEQNSEVRQNNGTLFFNVIAVANATWATYVFLCIVTVNPTWYTITPLLLCSLNMFLAPFLIAPIRQKIQNYK